MNETFMKEKPVLPLILSMTLPMVLSMLVNSLYNIIHSFFVAQISEEAMTAEDTYRSLLGMLITEEAEQFYEPFGFRKDPICFMTRKETPEAITNE